MSLLINIFGIVVLLGLLFLLSENKKAINWKTIGIAFVLQLVFALFIVKVPIGQDLILALSNVLDRVIAYGNEGIEFVFGSLASSANATGVIFFIQTLCMIIFFSGLFSALYYMGVLGLIVRAVGGVLGKILGTSQAETFVAVANVFLGQTEAPILVRYFIDKMTRSELFVVLAAGMGSVSGSILVGYNLMGVPMESLLIACSMVPLSSLIVAKLLIPETEESKIDKIEIDRKGANSNLIEAISSGAVDGMQLALNIAASLIAFIGLIALINGILGIVGLSLEQILGWVFTPFAFMMGIPMDDVQTVAQLLGIKISVNEFVAFSQYAEVMNTLSPRASQMVAIALAGFANIASIAICVSGISLLAPSRRKEIARVAIKAMLAGAAISYFSALIVGLFI